jgi:23S rRNA maturation-related 3'-5' exoribonuclease YhaM
MDLEYFKEELEDIKDDGIRTLTLECLKRAPTYFWYKPASSTGKYHHPDENEFAGLLLHTKRVYKVAKVLIDIQDIPPAEDVIKSACILHDIKKYGEGTSQWTVKNHPELGFTFILKIYTETKLLLPTQEITTSIADAVRSHMGKWGTSPPTSNEAKIVHLADCIATSYLP